MKKLIVVSDKSEFGLWMKIGRKLVKSRNYTIEDTKVFNNFITVEQPELLYFDLHKNYEATDMNDLMQKINDFPLSAVIMEASPVKIDLYSLLSPAIFLRRIFLPSKPIGTNLTYTGH